MSEESFIDQIKKDLASMPIRTEPKNAREVVASLKDHILECLEEKEASLEDVFEVVRERIPENIKMTFSTFKKYWQEVRSTTGLTKKRPKDNRKKNTSQPMAEKSKQPVATQHEVTTDTDKEGSSDVEAFIREFESDMEEEFRTSLQADT